MGGFVTVAAAGGKTAEAALLQARDATARLEIAIEAAKAAGAPISPNAVSTLATYDAAVARATEDLEKHSAASGRGSQANRLFQVQAQASTEALGPFGRALGVLAQGTDSWVTTLARAALPLAAVLGAAVALDRGLKGLQERGVDVSTIGDITAGVMDRLAVSLGGTSKEGVGLEKAFRTAAAGLADLTATTKSYLDVADLLAAANLKPELVLEQLAATIPDVSQKLGALGENYAAMPSRADLAAASLERFNQQIDRIRVIDPTKANELAAALVKLAAEGNLTRETLAPLVDAANKGNDAYNTFAQTLKDRYGPNTAEAVKATSFLTAEAASLKTRIDALSESGATEAHIFASLGPEIQKVATTASYFGSIVALLPPEIQALIARLQAWAAAHGGVNAEIDKTRAKIQDEVNSFNAIRDAVDQGTQRFGDHRAAVTALSGPIEKLVADLQKQRDTEGLLGATEQSMLDTLTKWLAELGKQPGATTAAQKALDEYAKKVADVTVKLQEHQKALQDDLVKIEERRQKEISASAEVAQKTIADLTLEISQTQHSYDQRAISGEDYNVKINTLFADLAKARTKAYEQEVAINRDSDKAKDDLLTKDSEVTAKLLKNREDLNATAQVGTRLAQERAEQEKAVIVELQDQAQKEAVAKTAVDQHAQSTRDFTRDLKVLIGDVDTHTARVKANADAHVALQGAIAGTRAQVQGLAQDALAAAAALDAITGISSGGSTSLSE